VDPLVATLPAPPLLGPFSSGRPGTIVGLTPMQGTSLKAMHAFPREFSITMADGSAGVTFALSDYTF